LKHALVILCLAIVGCTQSERDAREYLLKKYPPGMPRAELEQRLLAEHWKRTIDEIRPSEGWSTSSDHSRREHVQRVESAAGHRITRWQQYQNVASIFSLAIAGFYFDESDRLLDIDAHITD
jgi:hypothetical protein